MQTYQLPHSKKLLGISVRTTNANEMHSETAKIADLWDTFWRIAAPKMPAQGAVYGVYTHYESDHTGAFDVIACADFLTPQDIPQETPAVQAVLPAEKYLVFTASGEMPQTVMKLWCEVWQYFSDNNCPHQRAYTTDFECYKGAHDVEIYIAIQ